MSTLAVTIEPLIIHEHPNADLLELAQVGLYRAVVPKGVYRTGEYALYIPEQAVLPAELIEDLGLTGKLGGKQKDRVCTVRLRGEISQGIVCRPTAVKEGLPDYQWGEPFANEHWDFAELLGIVKWVPPIPIHLAGEVYAAPDLLPWLEIENIKRYPNIFTPGEPVIATEKIHGTCFMSTYTNETGEFVVTSKGFGGKRMAIKESATNVYWRAARAYGVEEFAKKIAGMLEARRVAVYGEVYGRGIQDLSYATPTGSVPGFAVFDIRVDEPGAPPYWISGAALADVVNGDLPVVPQLYAGPYDEALLLDLAEGTETVSGSSWHIREGIVVRPAKERYSDILGGRAIGKIVSAGYLTRAGGTEYE